MKKLPKLLIVSLLASLVLVVPASAHVLKTDGSIGGVLHIEPDDNPSSGVDTTYQIAFKDTADKFHIADCDCSVTVKNGMSTLATTPLAATSDLVSTDDYTFASAGVYTLVFDGQPRTAGAFQPFSLSYNVRVEGGNDAENSQQLPVTLLIGLTLSVILLLLAGTKYDELMNKTK